MGFTITGQAGIINEKYEKQPRYKKSCDKKINVAALRLAALASANKPIQPSVFELLVFNLQKKIFALPDGGAKNDRLFWHKKGWMDKETLFYCPAEIPAVKRLAAAALEKILIKSGIVQF
jgi:hypothetical protein